MKTFESIYSENQGWVKNFINQRLSCGKEIAQDLTQDVFVKLSKHLDKFDESKSSLNTFLNTIVRTTIIDFYRHEKTRKNMFSNNIETFVNEEGENYFQVASKVETDANIIEGELSLLIQKTLNSFNENQQKVCKLQMQGFQMNEIATELNIPEGTVKVYVKRFREIVKSKLEKRSYCLN